MEGVVLGWKVLDAAQPQIDSILAFRRLSLALLETKGSALGMGKWQLANMRLYTKALFRPGVKN